MKKTSGIFIGLFVVTTGIFGWLYLSERNDAEKWRLIVKKSEKYIDSTIQVSKSIFNLQELQTGTALSTSEATGRKTNPFTDSKLASKYITTYMNGITTGTYPTTSMWIDFGIISDLARMYSEYAGTSKKLDGVRLYFAKYPDLQGNPDEVRTANSNDNGKYDGKYTVVLVATQPDGTNHKNFFPKRTVSGPYALDTYEGLYNYHDLCPNGTYPPCRDFVPQ